MNLLRIKFAVVTFTILISLLVVLAQMCLFSWRQCFPMTPQGLRTETSQLLLNSTFFTIDDFLSPENSTKDPEDSEKDFLVFPKGLNQHIWKSNCVKTIETLCNFPIFPNAPDERNVAFRTEILIENFRNVDDGHRLLGYLLPNLTGEYHFAVATNGFADIWLSPNNNWKEAKRVVPLRPFDLQKPLKRLDFDTSRWQVSSGVLLKARRRYYIEILYSLGELNHVNGNFLKVGWRRPQRSSFEIIEGEFLSLYTNDSKKAGKLMFDDELPDALSCSAKNQKGYSNKYMRPEKLLYLEHKRVQRSLDFCEYRPSYLLDPANLPLSFGQYHGVYFAHKKIYSFPFSNVGGIIKNPRGEKAFVAGYPLDEREAKSVVKRYMKALKKAYNGAYQLESIRRVEKKEDSQKGGRYLLELVVKDLADGRNYILAEYVFQPNGKNVPLCYPKGLQWNRTADVYLILTAKNLGRWVHHFIRNVEKIIQETKDEHLHVVIYDFDSPDIDLEQAFQKSTLKKYHFIIKPGKYSRTVSLSEAIQSIKDPNAIVVTIDLHLDLGSQLINDVRKHCVKGKMVYAPQIVFLSCGGSSALPKGRWYHYSYGTIAMYKQDWNNSGGFSKAFANKSSWGGEDWDIIDSVVKGGLEIERKRSPWIYHYHHTKAGMW